MEISARSHIKKQNGDWPVPSEGDKNRSSTGLHSLLSIDGVLAQGSICLHINIFISPEKS